MRDESYLPYGFCDTLVLGFETIGYSLLQDAVVEVVVGVVFAYEQLEVSIAFSIVSDDRLLASSTTPAFDGSWCCHCPAEATQFWPKSVKEVKSSAHSDRMLFSFLLAAARLS